MLRRLEEKDAPRMLEWMHDTSVVEWLAANFAEKTLDDCMSFIEWANSAKRDVNLAVVDDSDVYMGTVSLKHLNDKERTAEFAICMHADAHGKGYAASGMRDIIRLGHDQYNLETIYWCVSKLNARAVKFYNKNGYEQTKNIPEHICKEYTEEQLSDFIWYKA